VAEPSPSRVGALRAPALQLGLLLIATYAYFMPAPAWNETSRFDLVRSLVERRTLDIEPFHHNTGDKATHHGLHYSDKAPGIALLVAPVYAVYWAGLRMAGRELPQSLPWQSLEGTVDGQPDALLNAAFRRAIYVCNLATNVVAGAATGVLLFLVLAASGVAPRNALTAAFALAVGSHAFPYATMFYGHVLAGACLFGAFVLLGPFFPHGAAVAGAGTLDRRRLLAAGALAGLAVLVELPAAMGAAALAGYVLTRAGRGHRLSSVALFALAAAPSAVALALYQNAAFGSPWSTGYGHVADPRFAAGMSRGLLGVSLPRPAVLGAMLFGRERGLLYVSPVLALGLAGLARGVLERGGALRREAIVAGVVVVAFLLMSAGYYMWWGGAALGPRHVVPALPFLVFGIGWMIPQGRAGGLALFALLGISAANQLLATAVSPLAPLGSDVLVEHVYGHFFHGRVAILPGSANVGMLLGLRGPASLLPLGLLWALALRAILASLPPPTQAAAALQVEAPTGAG
jgi:hypothetical protein